MEKVCANGSSWFMSRLLVGVGLACMVFAAQPTPASGAEQEEPVYKGPAVGRRVFLSSDLIASYNALGLGLFTTIIDRRVYDVSEEMGIEWSYLQTGAGFMVSPAYAQGSVHVEWQPAAFLQLRGDYTMFGFFGMQGGLRGVDSPDSAYDFDRDSSLPGSDKPSLGHRGLFRPVLAAQVGPVVLRNQLDLALFSVDTKQPLFYELEYDYLLERTDLLIFNQTQLLFELWKAPREALLLAGAIYDVTHSVETAIDRQRAGLVVVWQPRDPWGPLDRFRLFLVAGWIIEDRNRKDEPFFIIGVGTDKDLIQRP